MQRNIAFAGILAVLVAGSAPAVAQDSVTASAEREEQEANYKRLSVKVEGFEEALRTQQRNIAKLGDAIHSLREEIDQLKSRNESAATQDSIRILKDKIEEVDRKRREDGEMVMKKISALGKDLTKTLAPKDPVPPAPAREKPERLSSPGDNAKPSTSSPPEKGYQYKIKEGDTLNRIVTELRAQGYKLSQKQVMDANPNVNWNRLRIGQNVFIPPPTP